MQDPYYGGAEGFEENYRMLVEAVGGWLERMPNETPQSHACPGSRAPRRAPMRVAAGGEGS